VASTGVVEHLDKTPERWAFLLRAEDGTASNVELRGKVYGTLADGNEVELLVSRTIEADEVIVARRLRNVTLASMVTARQPGTGGKLVAFLVPQSIWTPIGGMGAAVFGYFAAGATGDGAKNAAPPSPTPTPTGTATATATSEPALPADDDGFPIVAVVLAVAVLLAVVIALVVRTRAEPDGRDVEAPRAARRSAGAGRFALVIVGGVILGVVINLAIT
jgi:hypothetical protein